MRRRLAGGWLQGVLWTGLACGLGTSGPVAQAVNLDMTYSDEGASVPHPENPSWDPDGRILKAHFAAAKKIWETILPEPITYSFDFQWDNDIDGLGLTTDSPLDTFVEINPNYSWFADPTPEDDVEFLLPTAPTLVSDLTAAQQLNYFPGTQPPGTLEVGYRGIARPGGPVGVGGYDPLTGYDLLSTIVHEIGHVLGLSGTEPGEYNIWPGHVGGLDDVLVLEGDGGHLAGNGELPVLMCDNCGAIGIRRFPTATDILVIAEDQGMEQVYLPRVGRISPGTWSEPSQWVGGATPDAKQLAYLSQGGVVQLDRPDTVRQMWVNKGSIFATGAFRLDVKGRLDATGGALKVDAGGTLAADSIVVTPSQLSTVANSTVRFRAIGTASPANFDFQGNVAVGFGGTNEGEVPTVMSTGPGPSVWTIAQDLTVGDTGRPMRLVVDHASQLKSQTAHLGSELITSSGSVDVVGAGAKWQVADELKVYVGEVTVKDGGTLVTGPASLGSSTGFSQVRVTKADWMVHGDLLVGSGKGNSTLRVIDDGLLQVDGKLRVEGAPGKPSEVMIRTGGLLAVNGAVEVSSLGSIGYYDDTQSMAGLFRVNKFDNLGSNNDTNGGATRFFDRSSAGTSEFVNHAGVSVFGGGGLTEFRDDSTAGQARFDNLAGTNWSGTVRFNERSSAGTGQFLNHPGRPLSPALVEFRGDSTAAQGTFVNLPGVAGVSSGGSFVFRDRATAGQATFATQGEGGTVLFYNQSSAGSAKISNQDNVGSGNSTVEFHDQASAAQADITMYGNTILKFWGQSTAGDATIRLLRAIPESGSTGGAILSVSGSSLGKSKLTVEGGATGGFSGGSVFVSGAGATLGQAQLELLGARNAAGYPATLEMGAGSDLGTARIVTRSGVDGGTGPRIVLRSGAVNGNGAEIELAAGATLDVTGNAIHGETSIGSLHGAGSVLVGVARLRVGGLGYDETLAGGIHDGLGYGEGGELTKVGPGALTLAGQNTYSGPTRLNEGTLIVNGRVDGMVIVNGGILRGVGTIAGGVLLNGGVFEPGNSPGTIHLGGLQLGPAATLRYEIGSQRDHIVIDGGGAVGLGGTLELIMNAADAEYGATYQLFEGTVGTFTGQFANIVSSGSAVWDTSDLTVNGSVSLLGDSADLSGDRDVDTEDLLMFISNWTGVDYEPRDKTWRDGDGDRDGDVDSADLVQFLSSWTGAAAIRSAEWADASQDTSLSAVPEPNSASWAIGLLCLGLARRRPK